jgi:hypothetical protein
MGKLMVACPYPGLAWLLRIALKIILKNSFQNFCAMVWRTNDAAPPYVKLEGRQGWQSQIFITSRQRSVSET